MSILFKGQSLPKDGEHYLIQINSDGTVCDAVGRRIAGVAVELPPHGRLIDADAFIRNIAKLERVDPITAAGVIAFVNAAPTIIEAEGE